MNRGRRWALLGCVALFTVAMITTATSSATTSPEAVVVRSKKIKLGFTDGFGGNSWRLVTTASARDEAQKCSNVSSIDYADGQGNTQKAISDIQGMVAKGVDALVVFPDAGKAMLPALRSSYKAGVVTVPYRVTPGGQAGRVTTTSLSTRRSSTRDVTGASGSGRSLRGGNVLMLSGPQGQQPGHRREPGPTSDPRSDEEVQVHRRAAVRSHELGPALTQKVLSAAIAKNSKIDVIVSDFGPSLVGALPEFTRVVDRSRRLLPRTETSSDASGRSSTRRIRRSSSLRSRLRMTTRGLRFSGLLRWPAAERSRPQRTSRRCCSKTP